MINLEKSLTGRRILVIDDLVEARSSLKKMVAILGADNIDAATDDVEAMSLIQEHEYDIILSDYNLGRSKDGQQILEEAHFSQRLQATSLFVVISSENAIEMIMGALECAPDGYITKPYTLNVLKERLIRIITIKEGLHQVNKAIDQQEYDLAITYCLEILKNNKRLRLPAFRILGQLLIRQKQYQQALNIYSKLLNERSVFWAKLGQALCVFKLGDPNSALTLLNSTLVEHPLYVQCYDLIAEILLTEDRPLEAQEALEKATLISPKATLRHMELGRVAFDNGDMKAAKPAFKYSIRLGRDSCHKSVKNYLQFALSTQLLLSNPTARQTKNKANEAFRALGELRQYFSDDKDSLFEASIIECKIHFTMQNIEEAKRSASKAKVLLANLANPNINYKLQMAEIFVKIEESVEAQEIIDALTSSKLSDEQTTMFEQLDNDLNCQKLKRQTIHFNDEGIDHYKSGDLEKAIAVFDQATNDKQAGISVLLNSVQVNIAIMERDSPDKKRLDHVRSLLIRIGEVTKDDERYSRYTQLRKTYKRLCRASAT
jgi:tetratricopeptide (TPR) repeat protein